MLDVALTLRVFAAYLAALAAAFVVAPDSLLPLLGFDPPLDFWIRVLGGILAILALYYVLGARAARRGELSFAHWTVWGRLPLLPFYAALVAFAGAPTLLLAVGVFESGCGAWTGWALRRSRAALPMAIWAIAIVGGHAGADAADSYRFRWSESGPLPKTLQGVVLSDGERYRADFETIAGAEPEASDVTLRAAANAPETFLNTALRTHFGAAKTDGGTGDLRARLLTRIGHR